MFLNAFAWDEIESSINAILHELKVSSIEQIIIDFPHSGDEEVDETWLQKVLAIWKELEARVTSQQVLALGVADFNLKALKVLFYQSTVKPSVNHFNIDGCCLVSMSRFWQINPKLFYRYHQNFKLMLKKMIFNF